MAGTAKRKSVLILVHGGCGHAPPTERQLHTLNRSIRKGYRLLQDGRPAIEAVEAAVALLEESGRFNAGRGSKLQMDGARRMDAGLMDGRDLSAGAVASVEGLLNPIRAARCVMQHTSHVLIVGEHARRLARRHGLEGLPPAPSRRQRVDRSMTDPRVIAELGTVGALARDWLGNIAAATSTGGIQRMLPGRVGDSPLLGAGTYADNRTGAVSATGAGEAIMRVGLAKEIALWMELGLPPLRAGRQALERLVLRTGEEAGALILSPAGKFAILHTTPYMGAGYGRGKEVRVSGRFHRIRRKTPPGRLRHE